MKETVVIDWTKPIEVVDSTNDTPMPCVSFRKLRGWGNYLVIWKTYEGGEIEYHSEFDSHGKVVGRASSVFVRNIKNESLKENKWEVKLRSSFPETYGVSYEIKDKSVYREATGDAKTGGFNLKDYIPKSTRPSTDRLFNKFHSTRLTDDFWVDPDHMAAVFKELGYYKK